MSFVSGILAALAAPLVMTVGFIVWDNHWAGSPFSLNMWKCNLAALGFLVVSVATRLAKSQQPFDSEIFVWENVGFLMLSSVIGILIGDLVWLEGLRLLGARRVIVMDSLKPFLAAVFGWAFLGEELRLEALSGISLTVVGILLVSLETTESSGGADDEEDEEADGTTSHDIKAKADDGMEASSRTAATAPPDPSTLSLATATPQETTVNPLTAVAMEDSNEQEPSSASTKSTRQRQEPRPSLTNVDKRAQTRRQLLWGYAFSVINVVLDTYGSVLTKEYGAQFTTWEINLVRFGFAGVVMAVCSCVFVIRDRWIQRIQKKEETISDNTTASSNDNPQQQPLCWYELPISDMTKSAWIHVCIGVLLVTFFTPALSNYALFQIALALALTLGSVGPLYALPLTYLMQRKEHPQLPSGKACLGALLAVAGIVVLAVWGTLE